MGLIYNRGIKRRVEKVLKQKKGFTLLEIVASIFILSFVFTSAITIFINVRSQTIATQERLSAVEASNQIREHLVETSSYTVIKLWLSTQIGSEIIMTLENCDLDVFDAETLFGVEVNQKIYSDNVTIVFTLIDDYEDYQVIHFRIDINYYKDRIVSTKGIIYEKTT